MLISPVKALEAGWIRGDVSSESVQPNGLDFTIDRVFAADLADPFYLLNDGKQHRPLTEVLDYHLNIKGDDRNVWRIPGKSSVDFVSDLHVAVPQGVAAMLIIRSTAARGFLTLASGLYDSGFKGQIGACLHNMSTSDVIIEKGSRIGQIVFYEAASAGSYAGSYQNVSGHWANG